MTVKEVMLSYDKFPKVSANEFLKVALDKMSEFSLGIVCIVENKTLKGIITDGDIRRKMYKNLFQLFTDYVIDHSIKKPTVCYENDSLKSAIDLMEKKQIWDLPVIDNKKLSVFI